MAHAVHVFPAASLTRTPEEKTVVPPEEARASPPRCTWGRGGGEDELVRHYQEKEFLSTYSKVFTFRLPEDTIVQSLSMTRDRRHPDSSHCTRQPKNRSNLTPSNAGVCLFSDTFSRHPYFPPRSYIFSVSSIITIGGGGSLFLPTWAVFVISFTV